MIAGAEAQVVDTTNLLFAQMAGTLWWSYNICCTGDEDVLRTSFVFSRFIETDVALVRSFRRWLARCGGNTMLLQGRCILRTAVQVSDFRASFKQTQRWRFVWDVFQRGCHVCK